MHINGKKVSLLGREMVLERFRKAKGDVPYGPWEEDVPGDDPGDKEETEEDVGHGVVVGVLEHFCNLKVERQNVTRVCEC